MHHKSYNRLALMALLSFLSMYILMYTMVDIWDNVFTNFNQFYMAGLMVSPMILLEVEVVLMKSMYENKRRNIIIVVGSIILLALFWTGIR